MPVTPCQQDGKPGYRWGQGGRCFTYDAKDEAAKDAAKKKALQQGVAISYSQKRAGKQPDIPV
jgi:hypothetical protein